jgi:hypothetical protein
MYGGTGESRRQQEEELGVEPVVRCWGTGGVELRHWMGQAGLTIMELRLSAVSNLGSLGY